MRDLDLARLPKEESQLGHSAAKQTKTQQDYFGIFDEGSMGMYNAISDDELLNPCGMYKEAALPAGTRLVADHACAATAAMFAEMGMAVHVCGQAKEG